MTYDPNEPLKFEWCIGFYQGEMAKRVVELATEGTGYFIRQSAGKGTALQVEAAFRRAIDSPTPDHLQVADPVASMRLDKLWRERHSTEDHATEVKRASDKTIASVRKMLEDRKKLKANL